MPITPVCIYAPYADGVRAMTYIPGKILRAGLEKFAGETLKTELRDMWFSNACISDGTDRLLPLPLCMALVKLDKNQLHYRLASGKDPQKVEQEINLGDAYARGFGERLTVYTKPETERITSRDGEMYDALSRGQLFKGTIFGEDAGLRELAQYLQAHPLTFLGHLTQEGFGVVFIKVERLAEKKIPSEYYARSFDVSCLSPALIMNGAGMPDTGTEGFLDEIERVLHARGSLRIVGSYMDVYRDAGWDVCRGQDGVADRCLAQGSVMRLETRDGRPMDISPLLHTFIGERTKDGYGEIMAYPARDCYYRAAVQKPAVKYGMDIPLSYKSLQISANLTSQVIQLRLKRSIQSVALADQHDRKGDITIPLTLLRLIRDRYNPAVSDELLARWYVEEIEEDRDEFFSE